MEFSERGSLLCTHLEAFVPIEIAILQRQGGVTDWHIEEAQRRIQALREPGASEALFYVERRETRKTMGILVECLAILAFTPGGISAYGCHFEVKNEAMEKAMKTKLFECVVASYGDEHRGDVLSKEAALKSADQIRGQIVDNETGLGTAKKWHIVSTRIEEHEEGRGVIIASCKPVTESEQREYELAAALLNLATWYACDTGREEPLETVQEYLAAFPIGQGILRQKSENMLSTELLPMAGKS